MIIVLLIVFGFAGAIAALVRFGMAETFAPLKERRTPVSSPAAEAHSYFERYIPPKTSGQGEAL